MSSDDNGKKDENSSSSNNNNSATSSSFPPPPSSPSPPSPPPVRPLSWYSAISTMTLGAFGRGSGRGIPTATSHNSTNMNSSGTSNLRQPRYNNRSSISPSATGRTIAETSPRSAAAVATSSSTSGVGRPGSIPISFLINPDPESSVPPPPRMHPRASSSTSSPSPSSSSPSYSLSFAERWMAFSSPSSSPSTTTTPPVESTSFTNAEQPRRSPRPRSTASFFSSEPPNMSSSPPSQSSSAASASYVHQTIGGRRRSAVQPTTSQSFHHFSQHLRRNSQSNISVSSITTTSLNPIRPLNSFSQTESTIAYSSPSTRLRSASAASNTIANVDNSSRSRAFSNHSLSGSESSIGRHLFGNTDHSPRNNSFNSPNYNNDYIDGTPLPPSRTSSHSSVDNSDHTRRKRGSVRAGAAGAAAITEHRSRSMSTLAPPFPDSRQTSRSPSIAPTIIKASSFAPEEQARGEDGVVQKDMRRDVRGPRTRGPLGASAIKVESHAGALSPSSITPSGELLSSTPLAAPGPGLRVQSSSTFSSSSSSSRLEELESIPLQTSIRRTTNPTLKTTKTGKILKKPKKITPSNRKSTKYTRFLQQESKRLAEERPDLSAQERMKKIARDWKVSDKNAHTTRRKSRVDDDEGLSSSPSSQPPPRVSDATKAGTSTRRSSISTSSATATNLVESDAGSSLDHSAMSHSNRSIRSSSRSHSSLDGSSTHPSRIPRDISRQQKLQRQYQDQERHDLEQSMLRLQQAPQQQQYKPSHNNSDTTEE